jgi:distribution and morphology protein 34
VFSKQKGLTLVFRNDPLESLKVSSTFDSIPFVRDYLQKEIEGQLRTLLMDEVPAIIHRLSLRLWVPEYRAREDEELARAAASTKSEEKVTDPLASPPQDPVDLFGNLLDAAEIASLSIDSSAETQSLFSQKNLLRLAALTNSHQTLSLFTPSMRDVVFRAWAGPIERGEHSGLGLSTATLRPGISPKHSYAPSTSTTYTFSDGSEAGSHITRPTLLSHNSSFLGQNKHGKAARKRKHRVVNLRKPKVDLDDVQSTSEEGSYSATISSAASEAGFPEIVSREREGELITPPNSPRSKPQLQPSPESIDLRDTPQRLRDLTPRQPVRQAQSYPDSKLQGPPLSFRPQATSSLVPVTETYEPAAPSDRIPEASSSSEKSQVGPSFASGTTTPFLTSPFPFNESSPGGILEQAWMMKMAGEIVGTGRRHLRLLMAPRSWMLWVVCYDMGYMLYYVDGRCGKSAGF